MHDQERGLADRGGALRRWPPHSLVLHGEKMIKSMVTRECQPQGTEKGTDLFFSGPRGRAVYDGAMEINPLME